VSEGFVVVGGWRWSVATQGKLAEKEGAIEMTIIQLMNVKGILARARQERGSEPRKMDRNTTESEDGGF
jgi:hypothetical protein